MAWRTPSTSLSTRSASATSTLVVGGPCPDALCVSADAPWSGDVPSPYYRKMAVPPVLASHGIACKATNRRHKEENPILGYEYDVDGTLLIRGIVRGPDGTPQNMH